MFKHKTEENTVVYAVMMNLRECGWYMKSDFIVLCEKGLEKNKMFQQEYKDVDMSWIDCLTDFCIHAVKHGIDKYRRSKTGKTFEMVLLPVTLYHNVSEVTIKDQVCFVFGDVLQRIFCKYKVGGISRGRVLLDVLETKQQDNFLSYLVKSKGNGNLVFF
jgi:hypothetical protein